MAESAPKDPVPPTWHAAFQGANGLFLEYHTDGLNFASEDKAMDTTYDDEKNSEGFYTIKSEKSKLYLQVHPGGSPPYIVKADSDDPTKDNWEFTIEENNDNTISIRSKNKNFLAPYEGRDDGYLVADRTANNERAKMKMIDVA